MTGIDRIIDNYTDNNKLNKNYILNNILKNKNPKNVDSKFTTIWNRLFSDNLYNNNENNAIALLQQIIDKSKEQCNLYEYS